MLDINNPTTGTSFIDIETGTILTVCLYLFILRLFSPRITSIFYQIQNKKIILFVPVHRNFSYGKELYPKQFV